MVDRLCTSLGGLSLSAIRRYTALAAEREDCIGLTIGEPDLPTPAAIWRPPSAAQSETSPSLYSATTFIAGCARVPVRTLRPCPACGSDF